MTDKGESLIVAMLDPRWNTRVWLGPLQLVWVDVAVVVLAFSKVNSIILCALNVLRRTQKRLTWHYAICSNHGLGRERSRRQDCYER